MPAAEPSPAEVKRLFLEVADLADDAARRAALAAAGAAPAVVDRVMALVAADRGATHIATPVASALAALGAEGDASELAVGATLGPWRLSGELGRGGMGRVFAAERCDGQFEQRAAIKLLAGWHGDEALARLARERQILASLSHPHIARLLDGGRTPLGRPYLVMEFVDGQPIDRWIEPWCPGGARRGGGAEVLRLARMVADALAHAHRQLVVHCDIKPSNVLVDADGRVRLLDFGIAQLQGGAGGEAGGARSDAWTPRYASPEQKAGRPAGPASDVHAFGAMLGELLERVAAPRAPEWRAVIARATAADPAARHAGPQALVDDLEAWWDHRPVSPWAQRRSYVLARVLRRHWPWALAAGGAALATALFTVQLADERDRAQAAERQAQAEERRARAVSDFVIGLFESADPRQAGRADLPAVALLDQGSRRLDAELAGQPDLQAALRAVLGRAYDNLGRPREAAALLERAAADEAAAGRPDREAQALDRLAMLRHNEFGGEGAEAPARRALALREAAHGADSVPVADSLNTLGTVLGGPNQTESRAEALRHLQRALAIRRARLGPRSPEVAATLHNLGQLSYHGGDGAAAEALYREALDIKAGHFGERAVTTMNSLEALAQALILQRRPDDALPLLQRLLVLRREVHGEGSSLQGAVLNELGLALYDAGQPGPAREALAQALALRTAAHGADSVMAAITLNNLGLVLADDGVHEGAERALRRSLALRVARLGDDSLSAARARHNLASWLLARGREAEAAPLLQRSLAQRQARLPEGHPDRLDSELLAAEWRLARGDAVALPLPATPLQGRHRVALARLQAQAARTAGDRDAERRHRREAAEAAREALPPSHPQRVAVLLDWAAVAPERGPLLAEARRALAGYGSTAPLRQRAESLASAR